jgi:hypothetical protein
VLPLDASARGRAEPRTLERREVARRARKFGAGSASYRDIGEHRRSEKPY